MRIALCQINNTVGDLDGNARLILDFARRAAEGGAELAVFPELALTGYPPRDLVEKPSFLSRTQQALDDLARQTADLPLALIAGFVGQAHRAARPATNSAALLHGGAIHALQTKCLLPTYDVFDEGRNFTPADSQTVWEWSGRRLAVVICEDAWNDTTYWRQPLYERDPVTDLVRAGGEIIVIVNGSPYHAGKRALRQDVFSAMARHHARPLLYVNMVGGNDELVFDGSSFAMNAAGESICCAASFAEDLVFTDLVTGDRRPTHSEEDNALYDALVLGTRDYLRKCGFRRVLIGLSGGIDSTLVACIAVDAVGRENVTGVAMPGPYSSDLSVTDARALAENLGIRFEISPINAAYDAMLKGLDPLFAGAKRDVAEENIQARLRGMTLMALSNKWNAIVLTTGNKSEVAVGYCTLYGDMCGGLAVISDVPKTMVYDLCRVVNRRRGAVIPESVFTKPPSAELRPDQKDSDSLPVYEILDKILRSYIEDLLPPAEIAALHDLDLNLVRDIVNKVDRNEYKRQQAAPALKVTTKAFGIGRRFPIAQGFSE
jgi:NAD+ synthase/NAD+ synthase (glutamine-hydrolysing)